jgi:hypothetical protein
VESLFWDMEHTIMCPSECAAYAEYYSRCSTLGAEVVRQKRGQAGLQWNTSCCQDGTGTAGFCPDRMCLHCAGEPATACLLRTIVGWLSQLRAQGSLEGLRPTAIDLLACAGHLRWDLVHASLMLVSSCQLQLLEDTGRPWTLVLVSVKCTDSTSAPWTQHLY